MYEDSQRLNAGSDKLLDFDNVDSVKSKSCCSRDISQNYDIFYRYECTLFENIISRNNMLYVNSNKWFTIHAESLTGDSQHSLFYNMTLYGTIL